MQTGEPKKKSGWFLPVSLAATAIAGAGMFLLRGCWHRKMSWPIRSAGNCYQVCTGCGVKRLFDEKAFRAYGPYSYDLDRLIARQPVPISPRAEPEVAQHRSAS